jgi:hypothetical protein
MELLAKIFDCDCCLKDYIRATEVDEVTLLGDFTTDIQQQLTFF